jgi:thiol:disulfide interchange protein DsbD
MRLFLVLLLLAVPTLAQAATSNIFASPRDTVALISASNTPGTLTLALKFHLAKNWHIYWQNPGDAGLAPVLTPAAPTIFGPITFPPPELFIQGEVGAYVLSNDVLLPFTAQNAGSRLAATANWLVCSDVCIPEHASFQLTLPGGPAPEAKLFPTAPQTQPSPFRSTITPGGLLSLTGPTQESVVAAHFFPLANGEIVNSALQRLSFTATGLTLQLAPLPGAPKVSGLLELTDKSGATSTLEVTPAPVAATPQTSFLLLAFLGGLILNLMPCVFPVLALKAAAIARLGQANDKIRAEIFGYTAGVLVAMLALAAILLALRAAGSQAGWGFQFQSPQFVAAIAWLIFALGLNLAGVFSISLPRFFREQNSHHSIATGILAVVLATPCTAPFMGAAIAAALVAPTPTALEIFCCLGLGMASPLLLLAFIPGLARLLPRPGRWMLWLNRLLAIPMLATFAWLAWVLTRQTGPTGFLVLIAGAALLLAVLSTKKFRPAALLLLFLFPLLRAAPATAALTLPGAAPYTAARLTTLRAGKTPVFVDLTAAWCVTCLVNDTTTLKNPAVQAAFAAHHIATLVGDWTEPNPEISALLAANNRDGVPLYLYFAPGADPQILPQLLTPAIVESAIAR